MKTICRSVPVCCLVSLKQATSSAPVPGRQDIIFYIDIRPRRLEDFYRKVKSDGNVSNFSRARWPRSPRPAHRNSILKVENTMTEQLMEIPWIWRSCHGHAANTSQSPLPWPSYDDYGFVAADSACRRVAAAAPGPGMILNPFRMNRRGPQAIQSISRSRVPWKRTAVYICRMRIAMP
jgi:hypothetical protein